MGVKRGNKLTTWNKDYFGLVSLSLSLITIKAAIPSVVYFVNLILRKKW